MKRYSATAGVLTVLALALTGCNATGSGTMTVAVSASATTAPGGTSPGDSGSTGGPTESGGAPGSSGNTGDSSGTPASTGTPSAASDPGTPKCTTDQLTLDKGVGGPTAGHWFLRLINHSTSTCVLQGFPGVSQTDGPNGAPIGEPADRDYTTAVTTVVLNPQAAAQFEFIENVAIVHQCGPLTPTNALNVYPPDNTQSLYLWWPNSICPGGVHELSVRAITPM